MSWFSGIGHAIGSGVDSFDHYATKLDPLTHFNSWATANTLGKIPGVGGTIDNWQGKLANHPLEGFLGAGLAYGALSGGAYAAGAGGVGAAGGAGLGGVGAGTAGAGGADVAGLAAADSAAVGAEGAAPGLTAGYGPAASGSAFDWQGLARQAMSSGMKGQGGGGGNQWQPMQQGQAYDNTPQQKLAVALMQPSGGNDPYLPASQIGNAALAAFLMPKANSQQLYQSKNMRGAPGNPDPFGSTGSNY